MLMAREDESWLFQFDSIHELFSSFLVKSDPVVCGDLGRSKIGLETFLVLLKQSQMVLGSDL